MKKFASIDIGSQTIRLLVAECNAAGGFTPMYRDRSIVRLGEGMNREKHLKQDSIERAVRCISNFVKKAKEYNVSEIFPVATACVRNAENARSFLETVYSQTAIMPSVISGEEEALLSLKGVQSVVTSGNGISLIIDIGGGSTELIVTRNTTLSMAESIPLGVIGLSEKHLHHDPPLDREIRKLKADARHILESKSFTLRELVTNKSQPVLIGTAGTVTTLAAMDLKMTDYNPDKINGHILLCNNIEKLFEEMIALSSQKRSLMPGLETGRAIVIIPGTVIVQTIMEIFDRKELMVSDAGLLEGVILEKMGV